MVLRFRSGRTRATHSDRQLLSQMMSCVIVAWCDLEADRRVSCVIVTMHVAIWKRNDAHRTETNTTAAAAPSCWQCWSCCWLLNQPMIDSSVGWEMAVHELRLVRREGGMMPSLRMELWNEERRKMSVQICQMIRGVWTGMKNIHFIRYFVQSIDRNYPVLNIRVCRAGLLCMHGLCLPINVWHIFST